MERHRSYYYYYYYKADYRRSATNVSSLNDRHGMRDNVTNRLEVVAAKDWRPNHWATPPNN